MTNKEIVWIDERTSDYIGREWDFTPSIDKMGVQLTTCGEGSSRGQNRGPNCIKSFISHLQEVRDSYDESPIKGFIIDVNIPVLNLGLIDESLSRIVTKNGAYTGFMLARYILENQKNLSPFQDYYCNTPVLFLSISQYDPGTSFTKWMKEEYRRYPGIDLDTIEDGQFGLYMHLEKKFQKDYIKNSLIRWVNYALRRESNV